MSECRNCDLRFLSEGPGGRRIDLHRLEQKYRAEVYAESYLSPLHPYRSEIADFFDALEVFRRRDLSTPLFLDIGCSVGIALEEAKRRKYTPIGVELSAAAAQVARSTVQCEVISADVKQLPLMHLPPADVIYLNHTIEHFPDPVETLRLLRNISAPQSLLWINVPNVSSLQRNLLARLGRTESLALGEHFCYFSWRALFKLVDAAGYKVIWKRSLYFQWQWMFFPIHAVARAFGVADALCLIARRIET
jgi:2-polyprenyl-3-methyl-5-hydroxy-6-metoxy-1,4-benzoquinol methylase